MLNQQNFYSNGSGGGQSAAHSLKQPHLKHIRANQQSYYAQQQQPGAQQQITDHTRPKSTLSERLQEQNNRTAGSMHQYLHGSDSKNSSSQKKQRPGSNFIQKNSFPSAQKSGIVIQSYANPGQALSSQGPGSFSSSLNQATNDRQGLKKSKPPASMGAQTPSGQNSSKGAANSVHSDQHRGNMKAAKAQQRFENMEVGYQPSNPNPLNIEIGKMGSGQRVKDEDDDDTLGDVQINDNFSMGHPSAHHSQGGNQLQEAAATPAQLQQLQQLHSQNSNFGLGARTESPSKSNNQLPMARFGPAVYRQALDVDNLISVCTKKLAEDSTHKKALFIRGSSYLKKGMLEEAILDCNELMELDPEDAGAYYVRGCTFEKQGRIDESISDYNRVLELDPDHVNAAYARGACENKRGNFAKAIEDYTLALEKDQERSSSPSDNRRRLRQRNLNFIFEERQNQARMVRQNSASSASAQSAMTMGSKLALMSADKGSNDGKLSRERQMQISMLKNKNLNRQKILLSPGAGNLRGQRVESNERSVEEFETGGKLHSASQQSEQRQAVAAGDKLIRGLNQQLKNSADGGTLRQQNSIGAQGGDLSNNYMRTNGGLGTEENSFNGKQPNTAHSTTSQLPALGSMGDAEASSGARAGQQASAQQQPAQNQPPQANIQFNPELKAQAETFHAQGYAARKQSDYKTAIALYTKALEIYPYHFKALFNRGFAYDKLGQFSLAIQDYTTAIQIDPKNAYTYYNKGISLDRRGDFDEAICCFTSAIQIEPRKADFYHNRGFAYRKQSNFDAAIADYSRAIELDGSHFKAYYNRAFCWDKTNHLNEAEKDYIKAIQLQPTNVQAIHHLGTVREKIGGDRLDLALENFNQVIQLDPKYAPAYNGRGLVWDRFLKYDEAIADFTAAVDLDKKNAVYWHNRACCHRNTGQLEDSIHDFDQAIKLDGSNPIIYSNRGLVNRKMERFQAAIDDYANEMQYGTTNNVKALNNRAYCYAKLGQYHEAISDYSDVLVIDAENIHALHNRGISFERLGQYLQAIQDFSEVIKLDVENANAFFNRGCCYDSIGEIDLAISDYSVALELDMKASAN